MSQSAPTDIDIGRFYTPQRVQRKFHASEARYPLLEGGRGGGKSTALLWEAISQCLIVPGANCLLLRRTLTAMEKGGIEDLFKKQVPRSLYRRYTQKYQRYLELTAKRTNSITFTIPRRRWFH